MVVTIHWVVGLACRQAPAINFGWNTRFVLFLWYTNLSMTSTELLLKIQLCVEQKIKPLLARHQGSIEIIELTAKKVLRVRLHGACHGCSLAAITLQYGVQSTLDQEFPGEGITLELVGENEDHDD